MTVKWPTGKTGYAMRKEIGKNLDAILDGKVLSIDPASKSAGWALHISSTLVESGTIKAPDSMPINRRLWKICDELILLEKPDVLVIEKLRGSMTHVYLLWSVGMIVSAIRAPILLEMPVTVWRSFRPENYEKSDQNDAEMIGGTLIALAKDLRDNPAKPPKIQEL